jgi:hypothetical protein
MAALIFVHLIGFALGALCRHTSSQVVCYSAEGCGYSELVEGM